MTYINIPVVWNHPTQENLNQFLEAMDAHSEEKVLVHCEANYRATAFPALIEYCAWDGGPKMHLALCTRFGTRKNTLFGKSSSRKASVIFEYDKRLVRYQMVRLGFATPF